MVKHRKNPLSEEKVILNLLQKTKKDLYISKKFHITNLAAGEVPLAGVPQGNTIRPTGTNTLSTCCIRQTTTNLE